MKQLLFALAMGLLLLSSQAFATTYYFSDTDEWVDWPGYTSNNTGNDENGTPKIDSMNVTLDDNGYLTTVDIVLSGSTQWQNYNSLFINSYSDSDPTQWDEWDYFVHDGGTTNDQYTDTILSDGTTALTGIPGDGVYTVDPDYLYTMTNSDPAVRTNTPNGIDNSYLTGIDQDGDGITDQGVGWTADATGLVYSYDFTGIQNIDLSDGFFIAFAPFCANDVIGGGIDLSPVPEPTTMALLGLGLIAMAGVRRKTYNE